MVKPRVFISHSALNDPDSTEALDLLDLLEAALRQDFAVRFDKKDLRLGVNWRSTINDWVHRCDAAVALLSKKALSSRYVAHELSVLMSRTNVVVIPVFLTGVGYNDVAASALSPSLVQDVHSVVNEPDQARRVERVVAAMQAVRRGMASVSLQTEMLAECLREVGEAGVRRQLARLTSDPDSWEEDGDPYLSLAIEMMRRGIDGATPIISQFIGKLKTSGKLDEVFELVASSWVDPAAAGYVKEVAVSPQGQRALAVNGDAPLIARFYVWCASESEFDSRWTVAETEAIFTENAFEELKGEVDKRLRGKFNMKADADLQAGLESVEELGQPVFVTLPAAGVTRDVLTKLREAFPTVTFFLRDGKAGECDVLPGSEVKLISPPLAPEFEATFCELYDKRRQALDLLAGRS